MRRPVLIVLFALLLAGCGGEKTVSPTGPVEGSPPPSTGTVEGPPPPTGEKGDPAAGKKVFLDTGCGGCHAFTPAGSKGAVGPSLDEALKGKSPDFIQKSIVDPNAEIASGFQAGIMPPDYGSQLKPKQIADLVAFLQQGT